MSQKRIAELLGVSQSTVSRALRNHPSTSEKTRAQAHALAEKLGYHVNANARALASSKTEMIGAVALGYSSVEDTAQSPFSDTLVGVTEEADLGGYGVQLICTGRETNVREALMKVVMDKRVDGAIIFTVLKLEPEDIAVLESFDFPYVLINRYFQSRPVHSVILDNFAAGYRVADYFVRLGYQQMACIIVGDPTRSALRDRVAGYRSGLEECKIYDEKLFIQCGEGDEAPAVDLLMDRVDPPVAVFTGSDMSAVSIIQRLRDLSFRVPGDVSIVGFDNLKVLHHFEPRLTTFDFRSRDLGREATRRLIEILNLDDRTLKRIVIDPLFIEGDSTCPVSERVKMAKQISV